MSNVVCVGVLLVLTLAQKAFADFPEPPVVDGLSYTFYEESCPDLQSIVNETIDSYASEDITVPAGLLRLHFHDCFVQGCDASVLLVGEDSEQTAGPNNGSLRQQALDIVNDIKVRLNNACGVVVSCADILALAAKDSVAKVGGPSYRVPLGKRDSLTYANHTVTAANLPAPTFNVTQLIQSFEKQDLNVTDLVALSGGHTIGKSRCSSFASRLSENDRSMDQSFTHHLKEICPSSNSTNKTNLDIRTPNLFDNKYFVNLLNRQGLFTSDQDLYSDSRTKQTVIDFAVDQDLFFEKYVWAMGMMGQLHVLVQDEGEIRINCSVPNSKSTGLSSFGSVVEEAVESALSVF